MIQEIFREVRTYIQSPIDEIAPDQRLSHKISRLFGVLLIDLGIMAILIGLLSALEAAGWLPLDQNKLPEVLDEFPVWQLLALVILFIPLLEELIFRAYLRFDRNIFILPLLWFAGLGGKEKKEASEAAIRRGWDRNYRSIFYVAAIIFGLIHISNYEMTNEVLLVAPLLVLPQIVVGLLLGFLRVRYGFFWGFLLHALHNFAFLGLPLLIFGKEVLSQM